MIRVLVADDHAVVRAGIKQIIAAAGDMRVEGEAANAADLLARVTAESWDVLVMDLAMPGAAGLELLEDVRRLRQRLPILVLTIHPEEPYAVRALSAGASGFLNKASAPEELVTAIRTIHERRRYVSPAVAELLASHVDQASPKLPHAALSNREYQVLCLIASGQSLSDIAGTLALSSKTVSTFRARILKKLGLRHNAALTRYALKHGLVE
jgi:DNA-binding NarL/FixJ family response regulator